MSMTSDRVMVGNGLMTALSGIVVCGYFLFSTPGERLRQSFHSGYPTIKVPRLTGKENNWLIFIAAGSGCRWGKFAYTKTGYEGDRKSKRLNSSHVAISYDVF